MERRKISTKYLVILSVASNHTLFDVENPGFTRDNYIPTNHISPAKNG